MIDAMFVYDAHWYFPAASYVTRLPSVCMFSRNLPSGEKTAGPPALTVPGTVPVAGTGTGAGPGTTDGHGLGLGPE